MQFAEFPRSAGIQGPGATTRVVAAGSAGNGSFGDPRTEIVNELRDETRELLQAIKDVAPPIRRLALSSAPFGVRSELMAHQLGQDDSAGDDGFLLTTLGEAVLEAVRPMSEEGRQLVAQRAEEALGDASIAVEMTADA